jgi:hypothetical protein
MPPGYRVLASVTPAMQRWAYSIVHDPTTTYGDLFEATFDGVPIVAHVEHHTWTTDAAGNRTPGKYKGVTLYSVNNPNTTIYSGSMDSSTGTMGSQNTSIKLIEVIVVGTALFGAIFTVSKSYFEHRALQMAQEAPIRNAVRKHLLKVHGFAA